MTERSTVSRRSTRSSCRGFTLVELLVGLTVTLAVILGAVSLALSTRSLYDADRARIQLNQNLRASRDFLSVDIRQAGERLSDDFPAIEIINGVGALPDELVVRRNLLDTVLRSCRTVGGTERRIYIAETEAVPPDLPPPGCIPVPDGDGDGWPDNHRIWRDYRVNNGVPFEQRLTVPAYIYDPVTGNGEFFTYWGDDKNRNMVKTASGQNWQFDYPVENQCRLYLLEERRYRLDGDLLQVILNGNDPAPHSVVDGIEDFRVAAHFEDGTVQETLGFADVWSDLSGIQVTVQGSVPFADDTLEAGWSLEIMPRNVMSR